MAAATAPPSSEPSPERQTAPEGQKPRFDRERVKKAALALAKTSGRVAGVMALLAFARAFTRRGGTAAGY